MLDCQLKPIERNVTYLRQLYEQGHTVVISCCGRPSAAAMAVLRQHNIPYTRMDYGRPVGDFFVDVRSIDALQGSMGSQLGFYRTSIHCTEPDLKKSLMGFGLGPGSWGFGDDTGSEVQQDRRRRGSAAAEQRRMVVGGLAASITALMALGVGVVIGVALQRSK